jgi:hypothetical protein
MLTLGQAARLVGKPKTTLSRAIKAARLSATRRDDGSYWIDPIELSRVYDVKSAPPVTGDLVQRATAEDDVNATPATPVTPATPIDQELAMRQALAEVELKALQDMLANVKQWGDWKGQAERYLRADGRPWWRRLVG